MSAHKKPAKEYEKYHNPDKRCTYPFESNAAGYCWAYAHHVDGDKKFKDMEKICPGCECFMDKK